MLDILLTIARTKLLMLKGYSSYHAHMLTASAIDVRAVFDEKLTELNKLKKNLRYSNTPKPIKVAVLGCADQRYADTYPLLFQKVLGEDVSVVVYDLSVKHLPASTKVIEHDCTKTLPEKFDLIYSHMLINFLSPTEQRHLIDNARKSLIRKGIAIHIYLNNVDCDSLNFKKYTYHLSKEIKPYIANMNKIHPQSKTYLARSEPFNI